MLCDEPAARLAPCLVPLLQRRLAALVSPDWLADCVATLSLVDPLAPRWAHRAAAAAADTAAAPSR